MRNKLVKARPNSTTAKALGFFNIHQDRGDGDERSMSLPPPFSSSPPGMLVHGKKVVPFVPETHVPEVVRKVSACRQGWRHLWALRIAADSLSVWTWLFRKNRTSLC